MTIFHPSQIERARQGVIRHNVGLPVHIQRASRIVQWTILREARPATIDPKGEIVPFRRPCRPLVHIGPWTPSPGGAAA